MANNEKLLDVLAVVKCEDHKTNEPRHEIFNNLTF